MMDRRLTCVGKALDREATREAEEMGVRIPVYRCEKVLFDGRDVTEFLRGIYRHGLGEIWLTPLSGKRELIHEVAHALFCREHPEECERLAKASPEERIKIRMEIERKIREIERRLI